jgi:hypothetical protein
VQGAAAKTLQKTDQTNLPVQFPTGSSAAGCRGARHIQIFLGPSAEAHIPAPAAKGRI